MCHLISKIDNGELLRLGFLVDHLSQIPLVMSIYESLEYRPHVWINVDTGHAHSGVMDDEAFRTILSHITTLSRSLAPPIVFAGLFTHRRYARELDTPAQAFNIFREALEKLLSVAPLDGTKLSLDAIPFISYSHRQWSDDLELSKEAFMKVQATVARAQAAGHEIEMYNGDHTFLDLKRITDRAPYSGSDSLPRMKDLALSILAEVASTCNGGVVVNAGRTAMGSDARLPQDICGTMIRHDFYLTGWYVNRLDPESAILTERGDVAHVQPLNCGDLVRLYPYDAASVGTRFGWYLVVDSSREGKEDEIIDVYVRARKDCHLPC